MSFKTVSNSVFIEIVQIAGVENVLQLEDDLRLFGKDETEDLVFLPELVVKPSNPGEISRILKLCNENRIPVTTRGGGTGLSGGALPVKGGIVLSTERLNKIIEIDERNLQATVETGVITEALIKAAFEKGLFYPIDPASKGNCFIGGNIALCAGGPRVVKYGTIREFILNLEVVLPNGEIIWTGANTLKYASGYNLTQLLIGSEGTLGVITKCVVKLIPAPTQNQLLLASFGSNENACAAVSSIFRAGVIPSALEFMERRGVEWVIEYDKISIDIKQKAQAFLLVEVDGNDLEVISKDCSTIERVLANNGCIEVTTAASRKEKNNLWRIRRVMPVSVKSNSVYKEEDTVVPRAELPALIKGIKEIGNKYGFESVCYGHAGDGNLHVNIIKGKMSDEDWNVKLKAGIREIFELTVSLGGTISGEHGIGLVQKEFMDIRFSDFHINLMRGIKKVFDPVGILNPGKIF